MFCVNPGLTAVLYRSGRKVYSLWRDWDSRGILTLQQETLPLCANRRTQNMDIVELFDYTIQDGPRFEDYYYHKTIIELPDGFNLFSYAWNSGAMTRIKK
jgi:hypothetical protein